MSDSTLKLGIRGGALAHAQAHRVARTLKAEVVVLDRSDLRGALLAGEVDVVMDAFRNVQPETVGDVVVGAVPKRGDARDALCARDGLTLDGLPQGARVGTGSRLRRAQLLGARPDLAVVELHGEIDASIGRLSADDGTELDAVVLSAAGLGQLDRLDAASEFFGIDEWPTAPAQGALAIEVRRGEERTVKRLDHRPSRLAVEAERGVLARLHGAHGTGVLAAHAILDDGLLFLSARLYSDAGEVVVTSSHALYPDDVIHPSTELAERVSAELLANGQG